jgi:hypothetical protein
MILFLHMIWSIMVRTLCTVPYLWYTLEPSSLPSHFFGLILTFCTDLFSFFAPGTKATGGEFVPQQKVKISPISVKFSTE